MPTDHQWGPPLLEVEDHMNAAQLGFADWIMSFQVLICQEEEQQGRGEEEEGVGRYAQKKKTHMVELDKKVQSTIIIIKKLNKKN